jgi:hypothetical protein
MWRLTTFLFGGFGGISPILVDRAKDFVVGRGKSWFEGPDVQSAFLVFFLGSACFFLLGAIVAVAHRETDYWKAVVIGVSAPGLITAASGSSGEQGKSAEIARTISWQIGVSAVYAQTPPPLPGGYQLKVAPGGAAGCEACELKIFGADGSLLSTAPLGNGTEAQAVVVPREAEQILLWAPETNSTVIPLDQFKAGQTVGELNLEVDRERNVTNDLWRTFGNKSIKPYDFDVKLAPRM